MEKEGEVSSQGKIYIKDAWARTRDGRIECEDGGLGRASEAMEETWGQL